MTKTVKIKELYNFIRQSNMMGYIESEAALIRVIKQMTDGRPAKSISFHFVTSKAKEIIYTVNIKDLEN